MRESTVKLNKELYSSDENVYSSEEETYSSEEPMYSSDDAYCHKSGSDGEIPKKRLRIEHRADRVEKPKHRTSILKESETNLQNIINLPKLCCSSECLEETNVKDIQKCRIDFYSKTQTEQTSFIAASIKMHIKRQFRDQHLSYMAVQSVIQLGGLYMEYQYICKKLNTGVSKVSLPDGRSGMRYTTEAHIIAKQYLEQYAKHFGDDQPDVPEIHLPSCLTKKLVFKDYSLHCITNHHKAIKRTRFLQIWRMEFPNVKVRKHQKMTQCTECAVFKEAFLKKLSQDEFKKLEVRRKAHLTLQRIAREKYYKHRTKSQENPQQYLSLIIDNMDQSKTNLPRFPFVSKDQFASNCNVTLNCLMTVLDDVAKNNGGSLPPTLYLQADNAAKDNKNNYVLMFLAMLVKAEIVKSEPYRELDVTNAIPDLDVPSIVEGIQPKFTSIVTNMSGDLEKWMSTGRFMQEHLDWWKDYLETFSRRKERPNVPLPTNFPKFKIPKKQTPTLESNVTDVIDKHFKKCQKKSVILPC
ncbi:unnamed protein product [Mytilus edulis]|uniref:DUF7869 domain-containing protein n=1 Tax=Mytilus edulis TaxID=6550 RepID=A0A8S3PY07_MYTED|nr:unnamed protein product [Mytilus edulis]